MIRQLSTIVFLCSVVIVGSAGRLSAAFVDPVIGDYSSTPIMSTQTTPPNILILLDNSGSMSCSAYGDTGGPTPAYVPMELNEITVETGIASSRDDAEEYLATGVTYYRSKDLDFGRTDPDPADDSRDLNNSVGLRFADVDVPQGAEIISAKLIFEAAPTEDLALAQELKISITGQASGNPAQFSDMPADISKRTRTIQQEEWVHPDPLATPPDLTWTPGSTHETPNLNKIVQALVNRIDWAAHNAMVFVLDYAVVSAEAQRNVFSFDGRRAGAPPKLRIKYRVETGERYYGYFNPDWFWVESSNTFNRFTNSTDFGYKKVTYYDTDQSIVVGSPCPTASSSNPQWHVRYPGPAGSPSQTVFDNPPADETSWPTTCIGDAEITAKGLFDGNFMNYVSMRRIDVARQVLTGGKGAGAPGNTDVYGNSATNYCHSWDTTYDTSASGVLDVGPYDGTKEWHNEGGSISYDGDSFVLTIEMEPQYDPGNFQAGQLAGILQSFDSDAYWGLETFIAEGKDPGGFINVDIDDKEGDTNFISFVNTVNPDTSTPLGESLYVAMQYFKYEKPVDPYKSNFSINAAGENDPYNRGGADVSCLKSFVLIITDGMATRDGDVPATTTDDQGNTVSLEDYDEDSNADDGDGNSLDDVALFMHTNDLRNTLMGTEDVAGEQSVEVYTVYAFGTDPVARQLLKDTAKNGSFEDTYLANNKPDDYWIDAQPGEDGVWEGPRDLDFNGTLETPGEPHPEWDKDGDGVPDNYYEARNGDELKRQLTNAINNILAKSASGTAVSVLSTSSEGEGILVQAYFKPKTNGNDGGLEETFWAGYLQALWVDSYGNMREDSSDTATNTPLQLDVENDRPISFFVENGDTKVKKYDVSAPCDPEPCADPGPYPNLISDLDAGIVGTFPEAGIDIDHNNNGIFDPSDPYSVADISQVEPVWEAGKVLAFTHPDQRRIFTYTDGVSTDYDKYGGIEFNASTILGDTDLQDIIGPYLGLVDDTEWAEFGPGYTERVYNLINYVRGFDSNFKGINALRNRTIRIDGGPEVWKLADIVNSTPVTIQGPPDNYGLIYADKSYANYKNQHQPHIDVNGDLAGWETMVYAGANDGMLHAFTGWKYDRADKEFKEPGSPGVLGSSYSGERIGQELWAYIPRALLPHLKWYASNFYRHTYYVDLTPKVVDAKIFDRDATWHIGDPAEVGGKGWGTVLIGGLGYGGKDIDVDFNLDGAADSGDKTFGASYFAIDITNPREPELMWERSYTDMGLSMSNPAVVKVNDQWYIAFGSGPNGPDVYDGKSLHHGRIYVVDLKTGEPVRYNNLPAGNPDYLFDLSKDVVSDPDTHKLPAPDPGPPAISYDHPNAFMSGAASVDKLLNNNVDAFYIGETYDTGSTDPDWSGSLYKVTIPWYDDLSQYGNPTVGEYIEDPNDIRRKWFVSRLFDTPGPVTATPSLSIDPKNNVWVYFGTGRFISADDKTNSDSQYLYGIKDPFFNYEAVSTNPDYSADYYMNYTNNLSLDYTRLFWADSWQIMHPWTANVSKAPTEDCDNAIATMGSSTDYMIGDIYGDDTCIAYVWDCLEVTPGDCAVAPIPTLGYMGPNDDGDIYDDGGSCSCTLKTTNPEAWIVVGNSTTCAAVNNGQLGDVYDGEAKDGLCIGQYWECIATVLDACAGVAPGQVTGLPANCTCTSNVGAGTAYTVTEPDNIYYWPRPAGDCTTVTTGYIGTDLDASGGYCKGTYWGCVENVDTKCLPLKTVLEDDHTDVDVAALNLANPGCVCAYSDEPTDHVLGLGDATDPITDELYTFQTLIDKSRAEDGWFRTLKDLRERSVTKPALLGGLSLFTSFVPTTEACAFGGSSYLYALYYETGTAFKRPVIGITVENGMLVEIDRVFLGDGLASGIGLHVGMQEGNEASGFIQQSTGAISTLKLDPAFSIRSGLTSWREN